jgi:hypothetical protein
VVYYAGDANAGSKTIAINLPNDEEVQLAKGTRRLQLKNAMRAKFDAIMVPIAQALIVEDQRAHVTFDAFFANTMFHEVAHGLGIKNTVNGKGMVRQALQEHASPMEEGKADVVGLYMVKQLFDQASAAAGKKQFLIPYFIAAHPGTSDEDMMNLALWLKRNGFRADQVQAFLPSPMALASAMYYSGRNPLRKLLREEDESGVVFSPKGMKQRRLHKAFLRYHDAENWPMLREALKRMGRADLIGNGKHHLIPTWQPAGTGEAGGEGARVGKKFGGQQKFLTKHTERSAKKPK